MVTEPQEREINFSQIYQRAQLFLERSRPLRNNERGALSGLLAGIKPALDFDFPLDYDFDIFKRIVSPLTEIIQVGGTLVNKKALEQRLEEERELAEEMGWDFDLSLEENINKASSLVKDSAQANGIKGFLYGFPASSLRGYFRKMEITHQKRAKTPSGILVEYGLLQKTGRGHEIDFSKWEREDLDFLGFMKTAYAAIDHDAGVTSDTDQSFHRYNLLVERFRRERGKELLRIYQRYFGFSEQDFIDYFAGQTTTINNSQGDSVFIFFSYNHQGVEPQDVKDLREKTEDTFIGLRA